MKDTLKSLVVRILTFEAQLLLRRTRPTIIAVTGSVGKTATKDAIYAAVKDSVHARKSQKSYNSEVGVPLTVLGLENAWNDPILWMKNLIDGGLRALFLRDYPKVLILETGVDRPGDMAELTRWITPDIVVLTRLPDVPVHVEFFKSPDEVVKEKMTLVESLKDNGVLIYNHDDERICQEVEKVRQKSFGFSRYSPSDFTISEDAVINENRRPVGMTCKLRHAEESVQLTIQGSLGIQHAYSYAAACAAAVCLDVPLARATEGLAAHVPPPGRMRLIPGIKHSLIVDDTYNSSPVAAERALQTMSELTSFGQRKVIILGDMLELGKYSTVEHERIGVQVAETADVLVTIGLRSRKTAASALSYGLSEKVIYQYDTVEEALPEVPRLIQNGDAILVKASQGIRAERLVAMLMENSEQASELLVRQDPMWEKR